MGERREQDAGSGADAITGAKDYLLILAGFLAWHEVKGDSDFGLYVQVDSQVKKEHAAGAHDVARGPARSPTRPADETKGKQ